MLEGTDPKLIYEWAAYAEIEPFSEDRADMRNAITCMTIANAMGMKKRGGGQFKLDDFLPKFGQKPPRMSPDDALGFLKKIFPTKPKQE